MDRRKKKAPVRVRLAPSPTGSPHIGNARTALFNWLFARNEGGVFVLRIEDTDKERSKVEFERQITEGLEWLELDWDEGPQWKQKSSGEWEAASKGEYGPYRQSERTDIYKRYLEQLLKEGKAYYCYCTKEDIEAAKQAMAAQGLPPKYSGHCRNLPKPPAGAAPCLIRFKTPEAPIEFKDSIRGRTVFDGSLIGDFPLAKNPETALFNFAVVVDDELMRISHVIRGEEHFPNMPKQILIQRALGFQEPLYLHLPLILSPVKGKLSKRTGDTSLFLYRQKGYLPEALNNFLVLLGWHPAGNQEIFTLQELVKAFDIKRVQKSGAVFDQNKLDWINAQHIKRLSTDRLSHHLKPLLKEAELEPPEPLLRKVIEVERPRMKTLSSFVSDSSFFFERPVNYAPELLRWQNDSSGTTADILGTTENLLAAIDDSHFDRDTVQDTLSPIIEQRGKGSVLWPLRVALSGRRTSPDPLEISEIVGKDEVLQRIRIARQKIQEQE
jgi:glutamyl-tRNA synthetase